jgi:hypothetical protein
MTNPYLTDDRERRVPTHGAAADDGPRHSERIEQIDDVPGVVVHGG